MKVLHKLLNIGLVFAGLSCILISQNTNAQNQYFDVNGTTNNYGTTNGGSYSWDDANWGINGGTGATTPWTPGTFARFLGAGSYTVTVSNVESMAGLFLDITSTTMTINATNGGGLSIVAGVQGFLTDGSASVLVINAPISGPGGLENENGGSIDLYGTNSYAGGTVLGTSGGINFNNNNSFGTGPISWNNTSKLIVLADTTATTPVTLSNAMTTTAGYEGIFVAPPAAPITWTGPWTNAAGLTRLTLGNTPFPGSTMTISGPMFGATGNLLKDGPGVLVINGTNANAVTITTTNGLLEIGANGLIAGTIVVSNTAGALQLDSPTNFSATATLNLGPIISNSAVNLNYTGTNTVFALFIGGVAQSSGTYGAPGSVAQNQLSQFTGTGIINVPATPAVLQQPQSVAAFIGGNATFNVNASGGQPLTFQWKFNGTNIDGATDPSFTIFSLTTNNAGIYTVAVSNTVGGTISSNATLTVLSTNFYTQTIVGDGPISYWRLDETNGTTAFDAIGGNNGSYVNVTLNQPGYALADTDTAIGLPASSSTRGFVQVTNISQFNFQSLGVPFTLEAWAYFTNLSGVERLFSTLATSGGGGYAFGVNGNNALRFTQGSVQDADLTLTKPLTTGVWYYFVMACDGSAYNFFINGEQVGSVPISGLGQGVSVPLQFGANPAGYPTAEQVNGRLDEIAIYQNNLSSDQVLAHFQAASGGLAPPIVSIPIANPATNYVSLSASIDAVVSGQSLSYQWYKAPSTLLTNQTSSTLTIAPLQLSDTGNYFVQVSNSAGTSNSPTVAVTVLPIPTSATNLNLTNGLVLHLTFDSDYTDASGRGNNGTNVGTTSLVSPGAVGASALHYYTDTSSNLFNYVTLGVRPDLQFGATTNFSVSFWIRQPAGSAFTNLPFFTDAIGSTGNGGFAFAPYAGTGGGGWMWTAGSVTSPNAATHFPDANLINDGNWHHLLHVADRSANLTTYLDGVQVDSQSIVIIGDIDTTNAATIGQDPTGAYPVSASADIDDLAVWQRTLSSLEVSGIYLAGASNNVSFAPPLASSVVPTKLVIGQVSGQLQISWSGSGTLQASTNILGGYTNVTGAASPYPVPNPQTSQMYYRLKQQ